MRINRRQLLTALGLAGLGGLSFHRRRARAAESHPAARIVFFVQPHGHIPNAWNMPIPGVPSDRYGEQSLIDLSPEDWSPVLRPLHPFRERLLAIEGLAHTSVLADIAEIKRTGGDLNNHSVSVAGLLTVARALQISGAPCTGGARSLDQELALRTSAPGRFGSRVYGSDYVPNSTVAPFSFLGPGQATPIVRGSGGGVRRPHGFLHAARHRRRAHDPRGSPRVDARIGARRRGTRVRAARTAAGRRRTPAAERSP